MMTRRAIARVWFGICLGCFSATAAQLPPDVLVDKYLLQAKMLSEEKNHKGALEAMDKIVALQKEHDLMLPEEFPFHYAQTALAAGAVQAAVESVNQYLSATGREGKFYGEALELLVKAERRLHEPAGTATATPEIEPQPQAVLPSSPRAQKTTAAQPVVDCWRWNTAWYFRTASVEHVTACLNAGADPMARSSWRKNTPLHLAARHNENPAVIEVLLKAGADPKARDKWKNTPLHLAARDNPNPAVIEALLKGGANARADLKWKPLHEAIVINEDPAVIEALLKAGADPMARSKWKNTPLHWAARYNKNPAVIEALLKAGADPMARSKSKNTPLHWAAKFNKNPAVIETLLKAGADPNARSKSKYTPLHWAARYNPNPAVIEALLKGGADPNEYILLWAVSNPNPAVIETLLKAGADPMARDGWKRTPLHWAASDNPNPAVIEALLKAGADPNARAQSTYTPLHLAARDNPNPAVIEALLKGGADPNEYILLWAVSNPNPAVIEALLKAGADPNARAQSKNTPLHLAAKDNPNPAVIETLLKAGADPMARNDDKNTPLHYAARYNNPEVVKALIDAGADLATLDKKGKTPLQVARKRNRTVLRNAWASLSDRQKSAYQARVRRRKATSGPSFLDVAVGVAGGAAIATAGGGTEAAVDAGTVFAESVITGQQPVGSSGGGSVPPTGNTGATAGGGTCQVPGYPNPPGGVANLGFSWCPASVGMQVRAYALQAAGAQCAIATGSSSTPEQIEARRREIRAACDRLAALGQGNCQCPPGLGQ